MLNRFVGGVNSLPVRRLSYRTYRSSQGGQRKERRNLSLGLFLGGLGLGGIVASKLMRDDERKIRPSEGVGSSDSSCVSPSLRHSDTKTGGVMLSPEDALDEVVSKMRPTKDLGRRACQARREGIDMIRHKTPCENVAAILKAGCLEPGQKIGKSNHDYQEGPQENVYLELTKLSNERDIRQPWLRSTCTLYFDISLMDRADDYHVAHGWLYGHRYEGQYAESTDERGMGKLLRRLAPKGEPWVGQNEMVVRGPVPLNPYLHAVARPVEDDAKPQFYGSVSIKPDKINSSSRVQNQG